MSERDNRVKAFEKLMRGGLSSMDVFCMKNQLMAMGFFTAPASTKYHGNYEGGLFDHSFTVTSSLLSLTKRMGMNWKRKASPYIVGMLHDLCKCDSYIHNPLTSQMRKWLVSVGTWEPLMTRRTGISTGSPLRNTRTSCGLIPLT